MSSRGIGAASGAEGSFSWAWVARLACALGIAAAGCGSSATACSLYACNAVAQLSGSTTFSANTKTLDAKLCADGTCVEGELDLGTDAGLACASLHSPSSVCVSSANGSGMFDVRASWSFQDETQPAQPVSLELQLQDHATGEVLLDETRSVTFAITHEDSCHRCWGGEATF